MRAMATPPLLEAKFLNRAGVASTPVPRGAPELIWRLDEPGSMAQLRGAFASGASTPALTC